MSELLIPCLFFFNDTATTEIYTLSLHDALPISGAGRGRASLGRRRRRAARLRRRRAQLGAPARPPAWYRRGYSLPSPQRSEEHTAELQSQSNIVCPLLLEKKKKNKQTSLTCIGT